MKGPEPISLWLRELQAGDSRAAQPLWENYFVRLVALARARLPLGARAAADEEDVALSAFKSLCLGAARGRFPQLDDRDDLWRLLVVLTARKAIAHLRREGRDKRGGGRVLSGADAHDEDGGLVARAVGSEPSPEFVAEMAEECGRLLAALPDEGLREIALLKMEGYTREEIAERIGRSVSSVARRLELIREAWERRGASG